MQMELCSDVLRAITPRTSCTDEGCELAVYQTTAFLALIKVVFSIWLPCARPVGTAGRKRTLKDPWQRKNAMCSLPTPLLPKGFAELPCLLPRQDSLFLTICSQAGRTIRLMTQRRNPSFAVVYIMCTYPLISTSTSTSTLFPKSAGR
jgi:hypothetical protein